MVSIITLDAYFHSLIKLYQNFLSGLRQTVLHVRTLSICLLFLWLGLFCACSKTNSSNSFDETGKTPAETAGNHGETAGSDTTGSTGLSAPSYHVIPLTSKKEAPISACCYDLLHTVITITLYDSTDYDTLNGCFALIDRLERQLSRTLEGSEIYEINHSQPLAMSGQTFTVSDELRNLLLTALRYGSLSNGALDISIAPVSSLWDFTSSSHTGTVPDAAELDPALSLVDYSKLHLDGNTLAFDKAGMQLEPGAVAKGYIADRVKEYLKNQGITSAVLDLGGNILLIGKKPDSSAFRVGIQKPFAERSSELVAICELNDLSMVSSGIYERYFYDEKGDFYHHLLNPRTGYPCDNGLLQVTVISSTSADGDALSTACFVLGLEKGMELIDSLDDIYAVFLTTDGELHFSKGFTEHIPTVTKP